MSSTSIPSASEIPRPPPTDALALSSPARLKAGSSYSPHSDTAYHDQTCLAERAIFVRNLHGKFLESEGGMSRLQNPVAADVSRRKPHEKARTHVRDDVVLEAIQRLANSPQPSASFSSVVNERIRSGAFAGSGGRSRQSDSARNSTLFRRQEFLLVGENGHLRRTPGVWAAGMATGKRKQWCSHENKRA